MTLRFFLLHTTYNVTLHGPVIIPKRKFRWTHLAQRWQYSYRLHYARGHQELENGMLHLEQKYVFTFQIYFIVISLINIHTLKIFQIYINIFIYLKNNWKTLYYTQNLCFHF